MANILIAVTPAPGHVNPMFPAVAAARPGPEAMNAVCMYSGIDLVPDQSVKLFLSKGIPTVVAGDTEEKIFTASRVAWSGAGINPATGRPAGEQIRSAVRAVLQDKKYKEL
jgi:UDP:flavonoid glycosyltransferase YjiC (YdhE family)